MQGIKRRVVYIVLFEAFAIAFTGIALAASSDQPARVAGALAVASSVVAVIWNFVYNWAFERWESRQATKGRGMVRRTAHAVGFEAGLVVLLVPLFAYGLQISLWHALVYDIGLVVFFLVYGFVFNLAFDFFFGLPASALERAVP
jgi:uncharacterized membrane protein